MAENPLIFFPECNHEICDFCIRKLLKDKQDLRGYVIIKCPICNIIKNLNVQDYEKQIIKTKIYVEQ
jgi:phage FluMu protein Com